MRMYLFAPTSIIIIPDTVLLMVIDEEGKNSCLLLLKIHLYVPLSLPLTLSVLL